jgi:hypothetical protein
MWVKCNDKNNHDSRMAATVGTPHTEARKSSLEAGSIYGRALGLTII